MTHPVVSREQWLEARMALLVDEKRHVRERDELARRRRDLPWVRVDSPYVFESETGKQSLADLFGGQKQLIVYHFMMGPDWGEGCPSCSFWADGFDGLGIHLAHRDTSFVAVSRAPLANILEYKRRMGWNFPWVSSLGSEFNFDFHVSFDAAHREGATYNYTPRESDDEEAPGLSTFVRGDDGAVYHTNSVFARGLDGFNAAYQLLDLTPLGRHEDGLEWPMAWLRRHDQYE